MYAVRRYDIVMSHSRAGRSSHRTSSPSRYAVYTHSCIDQNTQQHNKPIGSPEQSTISTWLTHRCLMAFVHGFRQYDSLRRRSHAAYLSWTLCTAHETPHFSSLVFWVHSPRARVSRPNCYAPRICCHHADILMIVKEYAGCRGRCRSSLPAMRGMQCVARVGVCSNAPFGKVNKFTTGSGRVPSSVNPKYTCLPSPSQKCVRRGSSGWRGEHIWVTAISVVLARV